MHMHVFAPGLTDMLWCIVFTGQWKLTVYIYQRLIEPAHEIMVLIIYATSEGSGEPAYQRSLAWAFAVRTHKVWKYTKGPTKTQTFSSTGWLRMRFCRMSLRRTKSAIISWDGSIVKSIMK